MIDPDLKRLYAYATRARRCPCGAKPVGYFLCTHRRSGKQVELYSCQRCLSEEAVAWEDRRLPDTGATTVDLAAVQLELL